MKGMTLLPSPCCTKTIISQWSDQWFLCKTLLFGLSSIEDLISGTISYLLVISIPLLRLILSSIFPSFPLAPFCALIHFNYWNLSVLHPLSSSDKLLDLWQAVLSQDLVLHACADFSSSSILGLDISSEHRCIFLFAGAFSIWTCPSSTSAPTVTQ